jgi:zinc-binding alcohol dehydrogenase/oxidoreductase
MEPWQQVSGQPTVRTAQPADEQGVPSEPSDHRVRQLVEPEVSPHRQILAVAAGAQVAVTSSRAEKLERARALGASTVVNYREAGYVGQLRAGVPEGFDLAVDTLGGPQFGDLVTVTKPGGRIVMVGATAGPVPQLVTPRVFLKQLDILGTTMGSPLDFARMLDFCQAHQLRPIVDRSFPLPDVRAAQEYLWQGNQFGKVVLEIS